MRLIWDITNRCNLKCRHCGASNSTSRYFLSKEKAAELIENLKEYIDEVDLLGGEPLLYPYILDVLEKLTVEKKKINIITNGQFENNVADKILMYPLKSIFVSFDGLNLENDFIRGNGSWDKALSFLSRLIYIRNTQHKSTILGVNIVINKINKNRISEIIDFFDNLRVDYIQFNPISFEGNAKLNVSDLYFTEEEKMDAYENIALKSRQTIYSEVVLNSEYPLFNRYLNIKYGTSFATSPSECTAFVNSIYANEEGLCYPCRKWTKTEIISDKENNKLLFNQLDEFLHSVAIPPERKCLGCEFLSDCHPCPLDYDSRQPLLCEITKRRIGLIDLEGKLVKLTSPSYFVQEQGRYFVYFPRISCKTEYTKEGYDILEMCKSGMSVEDLSTVNNISFEDVNSFILQESAKGKLRIGEFNETIF